MKQTKHEKFTELCLWLNEFSPRIRVWKDVYGFAEVVIYGVTEEFFNKVVVPRLQEEYAAFGPTWKPADYRKVGWRITAQEIALGLQDWDFLRRLRTQLY